MNPRKRKLTGILLLAVLLAVCIGILLVQNSVVNSVPYHGEGYQDPATAIHITHSGDIIDHTYNSSGSNITRVGNTYTLTANVSNWVIIEKSNIVLDGKGFSLLSRHSLSLTEVFNVTVKDLSVNSPYNPIIVLKDADTCTFRNVSASFRMVSSNKNFIVNCTTSLDLEQSNFNTIKDCYSGSIRLSKSNNNSILFNQLWTQGPMLLFSDSSNNLVFGNSFEKFWWWLSVSGDNNKIVANNVWAGQIYAEDKIEGTNYIYHNNFFNFKWDQSADTNSANVWSSNGKGNYYGAPMGPDANHDGVGDYPYDIDRTNTDYYPLMAPVDIAAEPLP